MLQSDTASRWCRERPVPIGRTGGFDKRNGWLPAAPRSSASLTVQLPSVAVSTQTARWTAWSADDQHWDILAHQHL